MRDPAAVLASRRLDAAMDQSVSAFQARADACFNRCGLGPAPRRRHLDGVLTHRAHVLNELLGAVAPLPAFPQHLKGFDPDSLVASGSTTALDSMAEMIFTAAPAAVEACGPGSGPERIVETKDSAGRVIRKAYGDFDPWAPFKPKTIRLVTEWSNDSARGANSVLARATAPVAHVYADGSIKAAR
jgi:hypothetical protein